MPTRDEYAQAVAEAVECIEDRGFTASAYEIDDGSFNIQVSSPETGPEVSDRMDAAHLECSMEYVYDISTAYLASIRPSEEDAAEITRQCLLDAGFIDDIDASDEEIGAVGDEVDDDPAFAECISKPYGNLDLTPDG